MSQLAFLLFLFVLPLQAEDFLKDLTGDGAINVMGFGDSISYGQGDSFSPGGYLKRVREQAGISTENRSVPGEYLTQGGISRISGSLSASSSDIVAILEGTNDAGVQISSAEYRKQLQKMINIIKASGRQPVLFTVLPPCCSRVERIPFTSDYSKVVKSIAAWNDVPVADIEKAWYTTCDSIANCFLYNREDGLHPNRLGYDVIAHTFLATLYGIDIFKNGGADKLKDALGLDDGEVIVKPEVSPE